MKRIALHAGLVIALLLAVACATERPRETINPAALEQTNPVLAAPLELDGYLRSQRDHYNRVYSDAVTEPNAFLLHCLERIDATRVREGLSIASNSEPSLDALDVAMGDGRNTIALAAQGYRASGFDMSDVGINKARRRAAELGYAIEAHVCLVHEFDFGTDRWDVVVMMYFGPSAELMARIKNSVRSGGYIIIERAGGDRLNNELTPLAGWEIIYYQQGWGERDWSSRQLDPDDGAFTRVLARKR